MAANWKKNIRVLAIASIALVRSFQLSSQAPPVSLQPQNKNAVLETYNGIYCTYCPQGDQIAQNILNNAPNDVVLISIHSGQYSAPGPGEPDFRTEFGAALAGQTGLTGYPAGTVNRHVFPELGQNTPAYTAISRTNWQTAVSQTLAEPAIVNLAASATINVAAGLLTVNVEFYYTGSSTYPTNFLHVALLQNNIYGPQIGGAAGDHYQHNHILRHLITGQWGQAIGTTTAGYFEGRQYTYLLPESIRNVPLDKANLQLAVFISEGHQEILNGISVKPNYVMPHAVNAGILSAKTESVICTGEVTPSLRIRNEGNSPLYNLQVHYQVNDGPMQQQNWYGVLHTYEWADLTLPATAFEASENENLVRIFLTNPNGATDEWPANDSTEVAFTNAPVCNTLALKVELKTDAYGYETYWELIDDQGVVYDSGGNQNVGANGGGNQSASPFDPGAYGNHQFISKLIPVPAEGCYYLRVLDDYGDGMCCDYGNGYYRIKNAQGNHLVTGGVFTVEHREPVLVREYLVATEEVTGSNLEALVYPNPVRAGADLFCQVTLREGQRVAAAVYDLSGRQTGQTTVHDLPAGEGVIHISTANLTDGAYQLRLTTADGYLGKVFAVHH